MTLTSRLRLVAASIALLAGASAQAQFVSNGTFGDNATGSLTGWTTTGTVGTSNAAPTAGTGFYSLLEEGASLVTLLSSGFTGFGANFLYDLTFGYRASSINNGGNAVAGSQVGNWKIVDAANAAAALTASAVAGVRTSGTLLGNSPVAWQPYADTFSTNANYSTLYLVFQTDVVGNRVNTLAIDNVSAVPEPETYAMLLAGLGAVGFMSRRRRTYS